MLLISGHRGSTRLATDKQPVWAGRRGLGHILSCFQDGPMPDGAPGHGWFGQTTIQPVALCFGLGFVKVSFVCLSVSLHVGMHQMSVT